MFFTQLRHGQNEPGAEGTGVIGQSSGTPVAAHSAPYQIETAQLVSEGDAAWLLELGVRYANQTTAEVRLGSPQVKLVTESGMEVPEFFLAFAVPPVVAPEAEDFVRLRYWLQPQHRDAELWLDILGDRSRVELAARQTGSRADS